MGLTDDQRAFLAWVRWQTNGRTHTARQADAASAFRGDPDLHNELLASLYDSDHVYPDRREWWGLTAKGRTASAIPPPPEKGTPQ